MCSINIVKFTVMLAGNKCLLHLTFHLVECASCKRFWLVFLMVFFFLFLQSSEFCLLLPGHRLASSDLLDAMMTVSSLLLGSGIRGLSVACVSMVTRD